MVLGDAATSDLWRNVNSLEGSFDAVFYGFSVIRQVAEGPRQILVQAYA